MKREQKEKMVTYNERNSEMKGLKVIYRTSPLRQEARRLAKKNYSPLGMFLSSCSSSKRQEDVTN